MSSTLTTSISSPFRFRDLLVVGFLIAAILHCYYQPLSYEYSLEPLWFVETFDAGERPESQSHRVPPIVIDIDKDNVKDMVSVGVDNVLRVSRIGMNVAASHSHVVHAEEFLRKHMESEVLSLTGGCCYRRTVSASEHSLDHFLAVVGRGKGELTLQLLDASLLTLWEVPLLSLEESAALRECDVHVSTRLVPRYPLTDSDDADVTMLLVALHSEREQCASVFLLKAFDAQSGGQLWRHSAQDHAPDEGRGKGIAMTHLRFGNHPYYDRVQRIVRGGDADVSTDWTKFRTSFMRQLPHFYRDGRDAQLLLAYFGKGKVLLRRDVTTSSSPSSVAGKRNYAKRAGVSATVEGKRMPVSRPKVLPNPATMPTMRKTSDNSRQGGAGGGGVTSAKGKGKGVLKVEGLTSLLSNTSSSTTSSATPHQHPSVHHLNVVVFHGADGIRVIGLQSGHLLAALPLHRDVFYADVNRDGNIDSLYFDTSDFLISRDTVEGRLKLSIEKIQPYNESTTTSEGEQGGGGSGVRDMCSFAVLSGMPPHSYLFNDSQLCSTDNAYRRYHSTGSSSSSRQRKKKASTSTSQGGAAGGVGARVLSVPLLVRPKPMRHGGHAISESDEADQHYQHLLALYTLYGEEERSSTSSEVASQREEVLVVANNLGVINAYNRLGRLLWQQTDTTSPQREADYVDKLSFDVTSSSARPSLLQMSARRGDPSTSERLLLYCHQKRLRLHSLEHPRDRGKLLAEATSPNNMVHRPLIVDFDDDGVNDVIVITDVAILGYRLQITPTFFPLVIPFLVAFVIALVIFLLKLSSESTSASSSNKRGGDDVDTSSSSKGGVAKRRKQWTLTRATDNQHID